MYYLTEEQLTNIVHNAISYGSNKLDERYQLVQKLVKEVKTQELEEVQEEIQTESAKSVLKVEVPKNIVSYVLEKVKVENITPYLNKYGFETTIKSSKPRYLVVDWNTKAAAFCETKNGIAQSVTVLFEKLDTNKEATNFRDGASSLLESQEFDWF